MKRYLVRFLCASLFVVLMNPYSHAGNPINDEEHASHHRQQEMNAGQPALSGKIEDGVRVVAVKAFQYAFDPDPIVVGFGEKVRLLITSTDVAHGFAVKEFKVNVSIPAGKTESVEFTADKKGIFHAYCSVYCGSGHEHMQARLIVQ